MTINKQVKENEILMAVGGRLDTTTAGTFEKELKDVFDGLEMLTLDFTNLDYISSAGLRVLLLAQKTMNKQGSMRVVGVQDSIMEVLEVTGFTDILTIE